MIRSLTILRRAQHATQFRELSRLLDSLGFESAPGWKDAHGEGALFLTPIGGFELITGKSEAADTTDLLIEVSDLEAVHSEVSKHLGASSKAKTYKITKIAPTTWKSSMFTLELSNWNVGFWQFDRVPEKKAIEGELKISGARFGIVVSRFNSFITERLLQGAIDALRRTGTREQDVHIVRV